MDRELLERNLTLAEKHVTQTRAHVEQQRQIVAELERHGHDSFLARQILATLEQTLELHSGDRERLIEALARSSGRKLSGA